MANVLVTGSQGFIGSFLCAELLAKGHHVIGVDNYSKYGRVKRPHDEHPNFNLVEMDLAKEKLPVYYQIDYVIAGAAMIGGISYFHKYAYDLLATNERIAANTFDSCIEMHRNGRLKKIVVISSSMVYEGADSFYATHLDTIKDGVSLAVWPSREYHSEDLPSPHSTYGFQKLATEYFAKGAHEQYGLPYTIVRPFNCVGTGEEEALGEEEVMSGNIKLLMSHVLPDLVHKCLAGQDPLHILGDGSQVRCYTHGKDIARGILMAMESKKADNNSFNISTDRQTTVLELAELVWNKINPDKPFRYVSDEPYAYDVQKRIPCVAKARYTFGFEAEISLEESVDEVIEWMRNK